MSIRSSRRRPPFVALPLTAAAALALAAFVPVGRAYAHDEEHAHGSAALLAPAVPLAAEARVEAAKTEVVDAAFLARLRDEALNRSQVMDTAAMLTDVIGPRLTGSAGQKRASLWAQEALTRWGLANARQEKWGDFARGWEMDRFAAAVVSPVALPLIAAPKAWTPGLRRPVETEAVLLEATILEQLAAYKGKLKGKAVLVSPVREVKPRFEPIGERYTDADLEKIAAPPDPNAAPRRRPATPPAGTPTLTPAEARAAFAARLKFSAERNKFLKEEGAAALLDAGRGDAGTVFVQQGSLMYGPDVPMDKQKDPWEKDAPSDAVPQISVSVEHYNRIARMLKAGEKVKLSLDYRARFTDTAKEGLIANTVADLPGTDKADEIVLCGAHLDSWHSATGATDNAAGVAVCMEAVRLLKALDVKPRRTIRVALWTGEEQGLYGSRAYVAEQFGTAAKPKPGHAKVSAYFNLDNGTGKIRGIWGQNNAAALPIFAAWLAPLHDLGATTVTLRGTGSTDHVPFDRSGLPGFQFIQDSVEYFAQTHHSNQDSYDRLVADDLKQASLIMAAFLYNAAMRDELLPRKPPVAAAPPASPAAAPTVTTPVASTAPASN